MRLRDRQRFCLVSLVGCLCAAVVGEAREAPTYTLVAPESPGVVMLPEGTNAWMNGAFVPSGGVSTNDAMSMRDPAIPSTLRYRLAAPSELGFGWARNQPEYYLSDRITPPENVDWGATKEVYDAQYEELAAQGKSPAFLLNPDANNPCVYAMAGGVQEFTWVLTDGTKLEISYTIGVTCRGRPRRIYWTDAQYKGPPVMLTGKFVRIFDNGEVTKVERGTVTNLVGGIAQVVENAITGGVYIDESVQAMYAAGQPQGQFVIAYYDAGDYKNILCVEVIEATKPEAIAATGVIGRRLRPTGMGYDIEGLEPLVQSGIGDADDNRGDYLYQHAGLQPYSPKRDYIYPLRPTLGARWKAEVYWMETDPMGVQWPFELDQYENTWPESGCLFVRGSSAGDTGAKMHFPSSLAATLCDYQDPNGHALAVDGNSFETKAPGWSLLKFDGDDDVWFMPVHSVWNTDTNYFTRQSCSVPVGQEFTIRGGARAGIAPQSTETIDATDDAPGYIYLPTSGKQYNPHLYYETTNATAETSGAADDSLPSVIYAVNTSAKDEDIEVWWSRRVTELDGEALPAWIDVPALPQLYRPIWPGATEAPTIVIASQQGGAGESVHQQYGAATFENADAELRYVSRTYFPNGTGALSFWTRATPYPDILGTVNTPTRLIHLGNQKGAGLALRIGLDERLELLVGDPKSGIVTLASVVMPTETPLNGWTHIALTLSEAKSFVLYVNAEEVARGDLPSAGFLAGTLDRCFSGRSTDLSFTNVLTEVVSSAAPGAGAGVSFLSCDNWNDVMLKLGTGSSVRLTKDMTATTGCDVVGSPCLDLNGHAITSDIGGTLFRVTAANGTFTVIDSSDEQSGEVVDAGQKKTCNGAFAHIGAGAKVVIDGGTYQRFSTMTNGAFACVDGELVLKHGVVRDCSADGSGGAVQVGRGGRFTMTGGRITGCAAARGGAVAVAGSFRMEVGLIASNTAHGVASAVEVVANGGSVVLQGGLTDVEPTAANVNPEGWEDAYTAAGYYPIPNRGLYLIALGTAAGRQLAEITMRNEILTAKDIDEARRTILRGTERGVTGYYSFRPGEDLLSTSQASSGDDVRTFAERVQNLTCRARNVGMMTPGAPTLGSCVIAADATPTVYYENENPNGIGYNPNDEHAIVTAGGGGYIAWALRCDLNKDGHPAVLVEYEKDGEAKMQFFHVVATNATWPALADTCTAGRALPGPQPLTLMSDPWLPQDHWDPDPALPEGTPGAAYRDRKGQLWARCAGTIPIYMYYRMQEGFWFPQYGAEEQPAVGTAIPWLSALGDNSSGKLPNDLPPACWRWTVSWPETANEMKIGQTLYEAADGLPGVYNMKSLALLYPSIYEESGEMRTVQLTDPTRSREVAFSYKDLQKLGLSTDKNGGLTLRKGKYYFNELPPHLSSRIYLDANLGTNGTLCLIGKYDQKNAGASVLFVNVLNNAEREQLRNVVPESMRTGGIWDAWVEAVNSLGNSPCEPNSMGKAKNELLTSYLPRDSYALTAMGGTNWVVLIENDAPTTNYTVTVDGAATTNNMGVGEGDAISMHLFRVKPEYYTGRIVTREDEQNLLSQRLTVLYDQSFGGQSDDFEFEWRSKDPNSDGTVPTDYPNYLLRKGHADDGLPRITIGEQGDTLDNMVNKYFICRYRATNATCVAYRVMGDRWSDWCEPPALAEGWVQRVLNNVTPFNQLMTDLYENKAETVVSMIAKAGRPYQGDVAFNQDALTDSGLIELYETLLNKAESLSLLLGVRNEGVAKQLMQAVERLDDLYVLLGDEAYSDAKNPTVGFGSETVFANGGSVDIDYGAASSSLFCFDNQVRTLLDEELALLRGRTGESAPVMTIAPYYNRLLWNFTKGITAGEVAYAVNYNIEGEETVALGEEQAAALYPQGHGDAYGHYLSALKGWYRLLRNPYFDWARSQIEMNVADSSVNVDYFDEEKFARAALNVAKTAADVVDLTARKAYDDTGAELAGYRDSDASRSFGYGEWANRGAYGALCNWVVANSLLPADASDGGETDADYDPTGLRRIDRGTVGELEELCTQAAAIQRAEDRIDGGHNPLGLSANAIPFDISPIGANDGTLTHYEQIRERAGTALGNARAVLDRAQEYASRRRMLQEANDELEDQIAAAELAYNQELIGYYGKPYAADIGPGKTYEQGYDGPDLYHYMWMNLADFGLSGTITTSAQVEMYSYAHFANQTDYTTLLDNYRKDKTTIKLSYDMTAYGVVAKPGDITGSRPMQGTIQDKYATFLRAVSGVNGALINYNRDCELLKTAHVHCDAVMGLSGSLTASKEGYTAFKYGVEIDKIIKGAACSGLTNTFAGALRNLNVVMTALPTVIGMANDPSFAARSTVQLSKNASEVTLITSTTAMKTVQEAVKVIDLTWQKANEALQLASDEYNKQYSCVQEMVNAIKAVNASAGSVSGAMQTLNEALEAYKSEIARAELVLDRREADRKRWVNKISQARYNDMFFRQLENQALSRYTAAFDLAQKYVWETAKAYGYETGLLADDDGSAESFLNQIITSRSLGSFDKDGNPVVGDVGDTGLAGLVAQMDANWLVLKPRLGINNPQPYATWFSLRGELFRILEGEEGDKAWAKELTKHWVDDIKSNADFRKHCQPFQSQFGLKDQEPGLIIPFETTIDFAKNFFGNDLAGEDHSYDSTWYATRIYAAGVWFDGYNAKAAGYTKQARLANTPVVYLVPMGTDCMRVPGLEDGEMACYNVVDQVIAAPYAIGSQHLNDLSWYPSASQGDLGGADATTKIRKHPSFRAYFDTAGGAPTDNRLDCTRLVGRSVWNTRWMLVIPAGSMNADRDKALSVFINGSDENRDGKLDLMPVSDIKIGFRTYSNSGN